MVVKMKRKGRKYKLPVNLYVVRGCRGELVRVYVQDADGKEIAWADTKAEDEAIAAEVEKKGGVL